MSIPKFKIINGYPRFIGAIITTEDDREYKIVSQSEKDRITKRLDEQEVKYEITELEKPEQKFFDAIEGMKTFDSQEIREKLEEVAE